MNQETPGVPILTWTYGVAALVSLIYALTSVSGGNLMKGVVGVVGCVFFLGAAQVVYYLAEMAFHARQSAEILRELCDNRDSGEPAFQSAPSKAKIIAPRGQV